MSAENKIREAIALFDTELDGLIIGSLRAGVPHLVMANRLAKQEFDLRLSNAEIESVREARAAAQKIVEVGTNGKIKPG